jgi:ADP-heptose:LPS heptosyltransferase
MNRDSHHATRDGSAGQETGAETAAAESAARFRSHFESTGEYLREPVAELCGLATSADPLLSGHGIRGLFELLIEPLCDAFTPEYCRLYDRIIAQIVQHVRELPAGGDLHATLNRFGLTTEQELTARKNRVARRTDGLVQAEAGKVKRALIPSRVTIGADIAVTSVFLDGLKRALPNAEMVVLGPTVARELWAGDSRVRVVEVEYGRGEGLIQRLGAWPATVAAVDREIAGLGAHEYLVVDPDSRLTQLGSLPLTEDESRSWFFESRSYQGQGALSGLAAGWLAERFPVQGQPGPYLALAKATADEGGRLLDALHRNRSGSVVFLHLGVGGNEKKRLAEPFESNLLAALLRQGVTVILARGIGAGEAARTERHLADMTADGRRVARLTAAIGDSVANTSATSADILLFEGSFGLMAATLAGCDAYVGYDSAGQHAAAALAVPAIDVFADESTPRIAERWRPEGPGPVWVIRAWDEGGDGTGVVSAGLVDRVLACLAETPGGL